MKLQVWSMAGLISPVVCSESRTRRMDFIDGFLAYADKV